MILQTATIARVTFVESLRQPVLFVLVLLSGALQLFNTWNTGFSMADTESSQVQGDTKLLFDIGLATIFVIATILAGFLATAVISREIENKTVLTLVSKPVARYVLVIGKFLGVASAILMATLVMIIFLLMGIRHGVMSTAADELDAPVLIFSFASVFLSLVIAGWCNYFYGSNFPQTFMLSLTPLVALGYVAVLFFNKEWKVQPVTTDLKDQVLLASVSLSMAVLVLTAVATAASTRLGQVMTIIVCLGVFVASLLSNYFIGRHVFANKPIGTIVKAQPEDAAKPDFTGQGDYFKITLQQPPNERVAPGAAIYFGPTPNGFPLHTHSQHFTAWTGSIDDTESMLRAPTPPAIIAVQADGRELRLRNIGETPARINHAPEPGDYVFLQPTRTNYAALLAWGVVPNLQFFWLLDAVSQNRPIPAHYVLLTALYAVAQVGVYLSLAIMLFQKRDVG